MDGRDKPGHKRSNVVQSGLSTSALAEARAGQFDFAGADAQAAGAVARGEGKFRGGTARQRSSAMGPGFPYGMKSVG